MNTKVIIGFIIGTVLLVVGSYVLVTASDKTSQIGTSADAKVAVNKTQHDWGTIGINDGDVQTTFSVKNEGTEPLKLFNVQTSCMCTTAQIKVGAEASPSFGMHTKSQYIAEVPAGETAEVLVTFDPAYHGPNGVGPITRQIMLETNDKTNPQLALIAEANVVAKSQ